MCKIRSLFGKAGRYVFVPVLMMAASCENLFVGEAGQGSIVIRFSNPRYSQTRAEGEIPDSSLFLLRVTDDVGTEIYDGSFGESPEEMFVAPGKYKVSVRSSEFRKPKFSAPQYGDDQEVEVVSGKRTDVTMKCMQVNSGVRLKIASDFLKAYPKGVLSIVSEEGRLTYNYREKRIAYFNPGEISVVLDDGEEEEPLFSRILEPREILTVGISAPGGNPSASTSGRINIVVDTTRTWIDEDFVIGGGWGDSSGGGEEKDGALDVTEAQSELGATDVWVYGYIVGCFLSSRSELTSEPPFDKDTNLGIAGRASVTEKESCLAVELKKGEMREILNLVDNPENKGRKLFIKGDIEEYYGTIGVKNITDYELR